MPPPRSSPAPLRHRLSWLTLLSFYIILLLITWVVYLGKFSSNVDQLLHDIWVRANQREAPADVVIVGIDHTSLTALGRWPWPRILQTALFNKLAKSEVRAVAADVLYVENDIDSSVDIGLGDAFSRMPIVVLPVLTEGQGVITEFIERIPIPEVAQFSTELGHIFTPLDSDGIVRRVNLKSGFQYAHWSAFGLALAYATGAVAADAELPGLRLPYPAEENKWIGDHQVLIPFYGPSGTFKTVPAVDVISGNLPDDFLKDKIVLVGSTATGLGDMLPTAVSGISRPMPGVEIHANIFSMLREGNAVVQLDKRVNFVVAAVLLAILLLLYSSLSPLWALVCLGVTTLAPVVLSFVLYHSANLWYAPLTASIPILISYFVWSWHRLEYVAEYLRQETDVISRDLVPRQATDNALLVRFFDNAMQHLPLQGWQFSTAGKQYSGGILPAQLGADTDSSQWLNQGDNWHKRFATKGRLTISIRATDKAFVQEFLVYIDSLSRVKERYVTSRLSAPLERVQNHTFMLSQQLDRLRQLKVLSDSIFAGSPAGLIVWSASGEVVSVNELARAMFPGVDIDALSLIDFVAAVGRDPHKLDRGKVDELIMHRLPWQINRVDQDTELVVNFSAVGDTLADRLVSASVVDVSDIRRSERSRAEMVDFLSHDLRAPLISNLYLLKDSDYEDEEELQYRFERMEINTNLSLDMIEELLNIARADNLSSDQFVPILFDLIMGNAVDQMSPVARASNITLDVVAQEDDLWIECDASLMERALVNVISNAIKYSPENTTVTVDVTSSGSDLEFRVADQGVGISPEMMVNLFQRFKREKDIAQQYKGIGLGLALVSKVVIEHGGTVRAESPGEGTVIVITLPLVELDNLAD